MNYSLLDSINSPADLKKLSPAELKQAALETRALITESVLKNGGHLASSLGAVEIALALHYVFDAPRDKILWDVGHQAYAHKIVTGRREAFKALRTDGGVCAFPNPAESEYDAFIAGHASTSLSAALGYCRARKLRGEDYRVAAVIGDGALTGGMAFEALNDIGADGCDVTIILNDNDMSISKNVGAMNRYFSRLRISKGYLGFKAKTKRVVSAVPLFGRGVLFLLEKSRNAVRWVAKTNKMFEQMGIRYYGPFDGNDLSNLIKVLKEARKLKGPVLVHLLTQKGCGFADAEADPAAYHGVNPAGAVGGKAFSDVVGATLCELAASDPRVCAVTAAMTDGTGLAGFAEEFPDRFFDVGIAEPHAVTAAAAMAAGGLRPYVAIYSTFLQRAYDQAVHDVALQNLPVTFLIDRAGVGGPDGATHQGVFDISYLSGIPNLAVFAPKDGEELKQMLHFSLMHPGPLAIRYPRAFIKEYGSAARVLPGKWEVIRSAEPPKKKLFKKAVKKIILAVGSRALELALKTNGADVINARSVKPLDFIFLDAAGKEEALIVTVEDGILSGGFGAAVLLYMNQKGFLENGARVVSLGLSDKFIHTCSQGKAFKDNGLTKENLQKILDD
ncbi:MAG: 1-deoxy-D-xylulose-5-phosphate synthase [Firmicutes bacterium]|nr:1-deoxy-D-xylulose-5-phosphate synthase [Bacillota bacterium]